MLITITKHGSVGYKVSANKNQGPVVPSQYGSDPGEVAALAAHMALSNGLKRGQILGPSSIVGLIPNF